MTIWVLMIMFIPIDNPSFTVPIVKEHSYHMSNQDCLEVNAKFIKQNIKGEITSFCRKF